MIGKIIKYTVSLVLGLLLVAIICSPKIRTALGNALADTETIIGVGVDSTLKKMEGQVDQGELALARFDEIYSTQKNKLATLKGNQRDCMLAIQRIKERSESMRRMGKTHLESRSESEIAFYQERYDKLSRTIELREPKLKEVKRLREITYEDVRNARYRINMLKANRDAMDDEDLQRELDRAQENVANLQAQCNRLHSEVEVLELLDE